MPYPLFVRRLDWVIGEGINPEVYIDGEHLDGLDLDALATMGERLVEAGLKTTIHGPYLDVNPGSLKESTRIATVIRYEKAFEAARRLKPVNVVLHAGYNEKKYGGQSKLWLEQSMKTWPGLAGLAGKCGFTIAVENIFDKTPATLKALVDAVASSHLRICIDTGHLNVFSTVPMEEWIRELAPHIAEVHIHDNNGCADEHLPAGEGSFDFALFFSLLERYCADPVYTIEPHGEDMIIKALSAVRRFI